MRELRLGLGLATMVAACGGATAEGERPLAGAGQERPLGTIGAHEHGVARLNVAVEATHVAFELFVPGQSVYGFEGSPRDDDQRAELAAGQRRLLDGAAELLRFPAAAGCSVEEVRLGDEGSVPAQPHGHDAGHHEDSGHGHRGEDDHDHGHEDDHDHGHEDDHDHGHEGGHDHGHEGGHSEVLVEAVVRCAGDLAGMVVGVEVQRVLPAVESVDLQVIGSSGQFGARVPATGYEVRL